MSSQDKPLPAAKRFVYPFPGKDGKEITDADIYYTALAQADEGYYPLGANGQWHGGVHFNKRTAGEFDQDGGVRCIADGEVVAWRLDDQYPQITYPVARDEDGTELHGELKAVYSTGFVLVRHRLELPPPPKDDAGKGDNTTTTADTAVDAQQPSLVFYSLYMHLMCWNNYETHPARSRPEIWDGDLAYRVGKKATDSADKYPNKHAKGKGLGINLRKKGDHGTFVGFAARHATLRLGATDGNGYFVVESYTGDVTPDDVADAVVYKNELTPVPGKPKTLNETKVLDKPVAVKAGQLMGHLGVYERFKDAKPGAQATKPTIDAPESPRQMVHVEIFTPEEIEAFIEKSQARAAELPDSDKTRLFIEEGAQLAAPAKADAGIEPGQGAIIANAEQTSGYWTRVKKLSALAIIDHKHCRQFKNNQYTVDSAAKTLLAKQLGIPVTKMSNTARWDGHYYDTQGAPNPDIHRYQTTGNDNAEYPSRGVHVVLTDEVWIERSHLDNSGTAQASTSRLPAWTKFPLEINNTDGPKAGASKISKISMLDNQVTSQDGTRWWQVTIRSEAGTDETGWACTKQDKVRLCSPWDWPGFDTLEDSTKPVELHAYRLMSTSQILPEEKADAENLAKNAKKGAALSKLHQIMALDEGDRVKLNDIRNALKSPEQARALSHLIIRHESEWGGEMTKWDALNKFMEGPLKTDWDAEKKRIKTLQWKNRIKNIPNKYLWHLHPVGTLNLFIVAEASSISDNGIKFIFKQESLPGVTNRLHWPGGASGVTLGAGYDMKLRTSEEISEALESIGINKKDAESAAKGASLTGNVAVEFCNNNKNLIDLSDDQQVELLKYTVVPYANMVRSSINIPLQQHQFDALVSFAYNPAARWKSVTSLINSGHPSDAMKKIKEGVTSGGKVMKGLVRRRQDEVNLYEKGLYQFHGKDIK